jgi:hypothetical protein
MLLITCNKVDTTNPYVQKSVKSLTFTKQKKNDQANKLAEAPVNINYFLIDGRLKFTTEEDFNNFVTYIEDDEIEDWQTSIGFSSYYSTNEQGSEALDDDKVAATLNKYGVIEIDNYLIKLIPTTKTVLVMSKDNIADLHVLESATDGNTIIQKFTFDDEVFGILEEQGGVNTDNSIAKRSSCRDRYANENENHYNHAYARTSSGSINTRYDMKVEYKKIGISVKLYSRFANVCTAGCQTDFNLDGNQQSRFYIKTSESFFYVKYSYTPRCRSTSSGISIASVTNRKYYDYETCRSTRDCKNYSLTTTFSWRTDSGVLYSGDPRFVLSISDY